MLTKRSNLLQSKLLRLAVLALCLPASYARAQVSVSGYLKDFWQYSHGLLDDRPYNLNTFRARLTVDASTSVFQAHADLDNQFAAGSFFRTKDFKFFGYSPPSPWLTMQHTVSTGATNAYGIGAYRAWVGYKSEDAVVRIGRQRIAWGTGKLWNPTDVLNPYQPIAVEPDERRGVDAFYARAGLGTVGQAEYAWAPNDDWPRHAMLARLHGDAAGWDWSVMGGKTAVSTTSFMVGGDFAGTVLDGTLHGEAAYFAPQTRTPYWKAGVGYDYTVPADARWHWLHDTAFVFEYYRAGNGQTKTALYNFAPVLAGNEIAVARDYAGVTLSKDLHPLVKLQVTAVVNADDGSTFFAPELTWNALNDLYLSVFIQRFGGERTTEFGRNPNQAVLMGQYYF